MLSKSVNRLIYFFENLAPGRTVEIMRESSPQVIKTIRRGVVRVIISDQTGRVLHTPILQFDAMKRGDRIQ